MVTILLNFCIGIVSAFLTLGLLLVVYHFYFMIMYLLKKFKIIKE
jgi:hypothetical protein